MDDHERLHELRVAPPRQTQLATFEVGNATERATSAQPTGLKALANKVLERNGPRNSGATDPATGRNSRATCPPPRRNSSATPDAELRVANSLGAQRAISEVRGYGLTLAELREAAGEDWPEMRDNPSAIEALAIAIVTRRQRERGERPAHWTEICECVHCGPVYLWPGNPSRVVGCPWCFNRVEGRPIPRPVPVYCGACIRFDRLDHPHLGHCAKGEPEAIAGLWDSDRRNCERFLPKPKTTHDSLTRP
jgi:hypothetical protein